MYLPIFITAYLYDMSYDWPNTKYNFFKKYDIIPKQKTIT